MRLDAGPLTRLFFRRSPRSVVVGPDEIVVVRHAGERRLRHADVASLHVTPGRFSDTLRIVTRGVAGGGEITVRGLPRGRAGALADAWALWGMADRVREAAAAFRALVERDAYCNHRALEEWRRGAGAAVRGTLPARYDALPLDPDLARDVRECRRFDADGDAIVAARNDAYVARKRIEHAAWFKQAGGAYGLTDEQQEAILRDEDNCLVVAGAGTGKTSTVAGKVGYLLRTGAARAEQILLLSFTRKAAEEMAARIEATAGARVTVRTFHALGLEVLGAADGRRPTLSRFADDPAALDAAVSGYVKSLFADPATRGVVTAFVTYFLYPYRSPFEFETKHAHAEYVLGHDIRTLRGERVRSHEEYTIANWLFLNGIDYRYEHPYEHDTATIARRQYKPDFFFPDHGVYLEHFGVDRQGRTAPYVDQREYAEGMAWKRATHARFGTRLVETYSYERMEGRLLAALEAKLRAAGIVPAPLEAGAVLATVERERLAEPLTKLLVTFLNLFKGNCWTAEEVEAAARAEGGPAGGEPERALAFLHVFHAVRARYEADLRAAGEIDFNDMIALAADRVEAGAYASGFTHVIVDEFQDISRGRTRLLKALLAQVPDRRLCCVGDDWQSIYRFTGSDIAQMTHFAEEFGFTRRCDLTQTHRFTTELLEASSRFVQENPQQLRKALVARHRLGAPAIEILAPGGRVGDGRRQRVALLSRVLTRIADDARARAEVTAGATGEDPARPTVLVLGRYKHTLPADARAIERRHPGLSFRWLTAHSAKGLEADYTVVLDVIAERLGFPSEVVDDPVLGLVLAGTGGFPNAEERRLFYVALTRARRRCFVLTDVGRRSKFVTELSGGAYRAWVAPLPEGAATGGVPPCPDCGGGVLVPREGEYGPFWGCSNYPVCRAKAKTCPECSKGAFFRAAGQFRCSRPTCGHAALPCPACGVGAVVARRGPYGRFYGCTEWRPEGAGPSCAYRRSGG